MSMNVLEVIGWLELIDNYPEGQVYIDDGGLTLRVVGDEDAYIEIGGGPPEDGDETKT